LYVAEGPDVSFLGIPYPTRMAIAQLRDGSLWVWSPVALSPALQHAVDALGVVRHIVSPNKLHHLFLAEWAQRWPDASLHAPPGLARRRRDLHFDAELGDEPGPAWADDIDQTLFRGSFALEEVVFFHRPSRTAIVGDLVQRHDPTRFGAIARTVMRLDGLLGPAGGTPREWRATFWRRSQARAAREKLLGWKPQRLLIAHGDCAQHAAAALLERALAWV